MSFEPAAGRAGVAFMRDRETRSLWQVLTRQAVQGELSGERLERLERLPSYYSCWFVWSDFYTQTELYATATG